MVHKLPYKVMTISAYFVVTFLPLMIIASFDAVHADIPQFVPPNATSEISGHICVIFWWISHREEKRLTGSDK